MITPDSRTQAGSRAETAGFSLKRWWQRYRLPYFLLLPAVVIFVAIILYPALSTVWISFHKVQLTSVEEPFVGLKNYQIILSSSLLQKVITNSFVWTLSSIFFQFVIGFSTALILDRMSGVGNFLRGILLLPWVMPGIVIAFIWRLILSPDWGIANLFLMQIGAIHESVAWLARPSTAMTAVIVANVWKGFPFWMVTISAGLKGISSEIYDAAAVDGASGWRMIRYITLPLLRFPLFVTSTLAFIWTFNYFDLIFGMTRGGPLDATRTVPLYIYDTAFTSFRMGEASAGSVLLLIMMSVIIFIYARSMRVQGGQS
ncbi:MAG: sugar ABC transporter permease [Anaerolineae bacterium]|nr:sugar ABC transporter permease [Anaerolineae bacterium]